MYSVTRSFGLNGLSGFAVAVEADISGGLPAFDMVGLPDAAVKESRERVRAAVKNCGAKFPVSRITVNLAPARVRKEGTLYDLPILLGILAAAEELKPLPEDAAFLGDSLTVGFSDYQINLSGALICGYRSISPNTIVNRTTVSSPDRGEEVPLDVLTAAQPAKLYILIGTNALVQPGNDDSFLAYYGKMLDELRTALPNTAFYVQSVLPATQEKISDTLPGLAPDRLAVINAAIQQLCAERGCYYLDLNAEFADDAGCLMTDFAQPDGVHLTVSGYSRWVSYLCTHLPYSKNNPYQAGSTYYLSEDMKTLLADIP